VIWVVLAAALTGAAPVLTKFLMRDLSPETVLTWRYLLALLLVAPLAALAPRRAADAPPSAPRTLSSKICLAIVAVFGSGIGALLFTVSLLHAPAAVSNGLSKAGPLFVAFMAYVWLQEDVSLGSISMVAAMLLAAGMLSAGQSEEAGGAITQPLLGAGLAVAAGIMRAMSEVAGKAALNSWHPSLVAAARFAGGAVLAVAYAFAHRASGLLAFPPSLFHWGALLILAWVCTAVPILGYYSAVRTMPIHLAVGLRTSGTAVTAVLSWVALGEKLRSLHILGLAALLLAAYAMAHLPSGQPRRLPRMTRLSSRIVAFVAAVVAIAVALTGALQAWQLHGLLSSQTEASLSRAAAQIGHVVALQPQVPASVTHDYFARLVQEQMNGPGFRAEFSYIILTNDGLTPQTWAFRTYKDWPQGTDAVVAGALARKGPAALGRHDLLPVHVVVNAPVARMHVFVGYRAAVAWGLLASLALRTALLAALLALAAGLVAGSLVRGALAPLAGMSAQLRREIAGEAEQALPPSAETAALPENHDVAVLAGMAGLVSEGSTALPDAPPPPDAILAVLRPPEPHSPLAELQLWLNDVIVLAAELDGAVVGVLRGSLVVAWGRQQAEADDPLRAYAWCLGAAGDAAFLFTGEDWDQTRHEDLAPQGGTSLGDGPVVHATGAFMARAAARLQAQRIAGNLWLISGEAEL
jgi:drug/metabolite transporter (DMT)-like permease